MNASPDHTTLRLQQPRAVGRVQVTAKARDERSVLDQLHQAGSLKVLFPRTASPALDAVLLNTAGGITGGDRFEIHGSAADDCHLTLTTQASERAYRAQPGEVGHLRTRLTVGQNASIAWLPQETILFEGAALNRQILADVDSTATLLLVEPLIFGRHAMGEVLHQAHLTDRIDIRRDGELLFADRTSLTGDLEHQMARPGVGDSAGALATLVLAAPDAERRLQPARELLPATGGASLVRDGLLFVRLLAKDGFELRKHLLPLIATLTDAALPRTWTI